MTPLTLHIVSFDVPFPPDYGGIVDVFYKIKALHEQGVEIILHCFHYADHNPPNDRLNSFCKEVYYYKRKMRLTQLLESRLPYIVSSRSNRQLLKRLQHDDHPVLFEGLQSCFYLNHPDLYHKKRFVRTHNIEHNYYRELAKAENKSFKRWYLTLESNRLKKYESILNQATVLLSIAKMDVHHFSAYAETIHIPPFFNHLKSENTLTEANPPYVLFHGNLSVKENENAVHFILDKIVPNTPHKIVIAGKSPSPRLVDKIHQYEHVSLVPSPDAKEIDRLLKNASVNLLITFQQTGVKLKLLHALSLGKHIIINSKMEDDGLFNKLCTIADQPTTIIEAIDQLMKEPFTAEDKKERDRAFCVHFNPTQNARKIVEIIKTV